MQWWSHVKVGGYDGVYDPRNRTIYCPNIHICTILLMETIGDHTHRKRYSKRASVQEQLYTGLTNGQTDRKTFRQVDQTTDNKYTRIN